MGAVKETVKKYKSQIALFLILCLAAFLSVFNIWNLGYSNEFYAASVKSMLTSWKNFFFVSLDPGGWVTVDKPPVSLWIQAAFAKVFGFYGWSIILPDCIAAVASVLILYRTVRRGFGEAAGLISALVLALSPIFILISKTNNTDSILIFFMVCSVWAMTAAAETGKTRWLMLSMVFLGIAYNAKTLEAFLILPALVAVYLFATDLRWKQRILRLVAAALVLAAVSLSWSAAVDLTPADQRPYVDNSSTNSELELALQYNGIQRIFGQMRGGGSGFRAPSAEKPASGSSAPSLPGGGTGSPRGGSEEGRGMPSGSGGGAGNSMFNGGGSPSPLRMFNTTLGGQDSWLLPLGLFSIAVLLVLFFRADKEDKKRRRRLLAAVLLWGGSVVTMCVYFSISEFFHPYYLSVMAPFLAALVGIGLTQMARLYRRRGAAGFFLPAALAATAAVQAVLLLEYSYHEEVLIPVVCAAAGVPAVLLLALRLAGRNPSQKLTAALTAAAFAGLLVAPAVWTGYSAMAGNVSAQIPSAGPSAEESASRDGSGRFSGRGGAAPGADSETAPGAGSETTPGAGFGAGRGRTSGSTELIRFLEKNNTGEKFLAAVPSAAEAEPIILATGRPVMAVGGFSGSTQTLTVEKLRQMVKNGEIRYYLLGGSGGRAGGSDEVAEWVRQNGKAVDSSLWSSGKTQTAGAGGLSSGQTLYDLRQAASQAS